MAGYHAEIRAAADDVDKLVNTVSRKIGLEILSRVVLKTPVDTGRARANWQASLDTPIVDQLDGVDKGGGGTIKAGISTIQSAKPYGLIFVCNNVPYITRLNEGSSKQAPAGFVEAAIDEALPRSRRQ